MALSVGFCKVDWSIIKLNHYNPIEKSWANMKRHLRDNLRDHQQLETAIQDYFKTRA